MESNSYTVKTLSYEGPLGLLLSLIEKRKLHISDISLAQVTEDYLAHMNSIGAMHPGEISSFVLVASTLLLIKSKSLLPNLDLTTEEEGDIKNLEDRLKLFEIYQRLGINVKEKFGQNMIFAPIEKKNTNIVFLPDDQISRESMMAFAKGALGSMPKKVFLPKVEVKKVISIEEMISSLTSRIENSMKTSFRDFSGHSGRAVTREERVVVIVGFLAMLELVRQGVLNVIQENNYDDILIEKNNEPRE